MELHIVKASDNIQDLTGIGIEYLVDHTGIVVLAKFRDGSIFTESVCCSKEQGLEVTKVA